MSLAGLIWSEIKQLWELGLADYLSDMWNILDFITNSLYVATITLRVIAYLQVWSPMPRAFAHLTLASRLLDCTSASSRVCVRASC